MDALVLLSQPYAPAQRILARWNLTDRTKETARGAKLAAWLAARLEAWIWAGLVTWLVPHTTYGKVLYCNCTHIAQCISGCLRLTLAVRPLRVKRAWPL